MKKPRTVAFSVRLDTALVAQIDAESARIRAETGILVSRTDTIAALLRWTMTRDRRTGQLAAQSAAARADAAAS